ncbi:MAG: ABC transporter permease [Myxococcales bacterium]|nr:ABC transporter permease [Myxococcales bacterium]
MAPGAAWLLLFFLLPLLLMFAASLMPARLYGGVDLGFTVDHYRRFFDPLYLWILWRTVLYSLACTALCLLAGFPVAYVITRAGSWKNLLVFLVVLPFWTSFIVRTFAIMFLMRDTGVINTVLLAAGLIDEPLALMPSALAVMVGLVSGFLPFMVLPIYSSLEKLDPSLLEAAEVLGARPVARFTKIILPLSMPGIVAGSLLVFIPSLGSFVTADLLGGGKSDMMGNLVQRQFTTAGNWPFGSASSFVMMAMVLAAVFVYLQQRDRAQAMGA